MDELARPGGDSAPIKTQGPVPPPDQRLRPPTPRVALVLVAATVVGLLLYLGREALTPFIVGLLLVYLLDPPVERLSRLRVGPLRLPRWLAILVVYAIAIVAVIELLNITLQPLVRQLADFIKNLPELLRSFDALARRISASYEGLQLPPQVRDFLDRTLADLGQGLGGFDPSILLPVFGSLAGFVSTIFGFFIIPFWVFYLLKDRPALTAAFNRSLPPEWRADAWAIIDIVDEVLGRWVRGQLVLGLTVGLATFAGLLLLNGWVDPVFGRFALFFAVLAGFLELLPIIGPILSAIPPLVVAITISPQAALAVLVLYFAIQQLENTILVPKIQGDAVQLHPGAVVFALIVGGTIAGLLGAILALPVTAAGRDVFRHLFRRLSRPGPALPEGLAAEGSPAARRSAGTTVPGSADGAPGSAGTTAPPGASDG